MKWWVAIAVLGVVWLAYEVYVLRQSVHVLYLAMRETRDELMALHAASRRRARTLRKLRPQIKTLGRRSVQYHKQSVAAMTQANDFQDKWRKLRRRVEMLERPEMVALRLWDLEATDDGETVCAKCGRPIARSEKSILLTRDVSVHELCPAHGTSEPHK